MRTDTDVVFKTQERTAHRGSDVIDAILDRLPAGYVTLGLGARRAVVGPTGAFLLGRATGEPRIEADRLALAADACRTLLAASLSWVPFVDAIVVSDRSPVGPTAAAVVRPARLGQALIAGPRLLTLERVGFVAEAIRAASPTLLTHLG